MKFNCEICSHHEYILHDIKGQFSVLECLHCKFGKIDPVPDMAELKKMYDSPAYFETHIAHNFELMSAVEIEQHSIKTGRLHFGYICRFAPPGSTILEIGCGSGLNLLFLQKQEYLVKGIELSKSAASFAQNKLHLDVTNSDLLATSDKTQYDVVMLNHVLEHFTDLKGAMEKIRSLVAEKGFLYIRVPNHDSYDRKKLKQNWPAYLPFHISYFSKSSLKRLLGQYQFKPVFTDEYVSNEFLKHAPAFIRKIAGAIIYRLGLVRFFNGRTITIIAQYHG